jgi:hypothetical protein
MDLSSFNVLLSPTGQEALEEATKLQPRREDFLGHLTALSRTYPPDLVRAALETAILRREGEKKFPLASHMYFTRQALEQATSHLVAAYRSDRFRACKQIFDLGCSIGGDMLLLVEAGPVIGVDLDLLRLKMASENLRAVHPDQEVNFVQADLESPLPFRFSAGQAIFFDPGRRTQSRRIHSVHQYQPPLRIIQSWLSKISSIGVKLSPGVDLAELANYDAEVEFISLEGELKEAVIWFGSMKTANRRATLLPERHTMAVTEPGLQSTAQKLTRLSEPLKYLYEPDPAILRAGMVQNLAAQMDAAQLDPDIAYLTSDYPLVTPFAKGYPVEEWLPFNLKKLRAALRQRRVESVVVKKRGSPITPEALIHDLRLKPGSGNSPDERVVFLTHLRSRPIAVICRISI